METILSDQPVSTYTLSPLQVGSPCCVPVPLIRIEHLSVSYHGKPALQDVSLEINQGCITALIGPSGCGKTSFLSCLNRLTDLIPGCKVSGDLFLGETRLLAPGLDVQALRRQVGMVFQKPNPFPLSIRRNLEMPLREHGCRDKHEIEQRIESVLSDVGLWDEVKDRLHAPALALSGGQQQRLCIARALVLAPSVLLMDEPCSALDPISSGVVESLIKELQGRYTVVIVTHNLAQARRIANHAALFWVRGQAGTVIEFGRSQQIFEAPRERLTAAYVSGITG